ncbi:DJ-1/PfpI family protein [Sphingomonas sp. PvP056]|uniref:DJ-1/PfpI family protein n=1 Tax=Sphingomonas sp. PvP056 TaxID=3156392 RepID=UPI0033911746
MDGMEKQKPLEVGVLLYPGFTLLDVAGPVNVLAFHSRIHFIWKNLQPVVSDSGVPLNPTVTFDNAPSALDIIFVPGGAGTIDLIDDLDALSFLDRAGRSSGYVTSVCTGSVVLAAAGLLDGYRAACHWAFYEPLEALGIEASHERVCIDRNRVTGGGVTAGIDFGLTLLAELRGRNVAEFVQLALEYDPKPPFDSGHPRVARKEIIEMISGDGGVMGSATPAAVVSAKRRRAVLDASGRTAQA